MMSIILRAIVLVAATTVTYAHAWGTQGHHVIATIATAQLTAPSRAEVERLLAQEPGETLVSVSTWADTNRNPVGAAWHYINFPKDTCVYDAVRDCPLGQCVVAAIDRQVSILASNAGDSQKLLALKYVVHLVGDVHQPLHAGYAEDRGGNTYQLQAFLRGTNLHALWDVGLIASLNLDVESLASKLLARPVTVQAAETNPARAARESCEIVAMPGFYPDRVVDAVYVVRNVPIVEERLFLAGSRLATILVCTSLRQCVSPKDSGRPRSSCVVVSMSG